MQDIEVKVADMEDHLRQQPSSGAAASSQPGAEGSTRAPRSANKSRLAMPPVLDPAFSVRRVEKADSSVPKRRSSSQKVAPGSASSSRRSGDPGRRRSEAPEAAAPSEDRREGRERPERRSHGEGEVRASRDRSNRSDRRPREGERERMTQSATGPLSQGSTRGGGYNVPPRVARGEPPQEAWD
jgi:hypothetical protein